MIKFHHFGIAIDDDTRDKYTHIKWVYDPYQKIYVAMSEVCDNVEYVNSEFTSRFIDDPYYHVCYEVDDIDFYVDAYSRFGFIKIVDTKATLFDERRIAFITNGREILEFLQCE